MAITFAVRGNSMNARYSSSGKTPGQLRGTGSAAGTGTTVVNSAATGMIGSSYIDQYQSVNERHGLIYPGGANLWTGQPFSILLRCAKKVNAVDMCLFSIAGVASETQGVIKCFLGGGSKNIFLAINADYNQTILAQTDIGTGLTIDTFHDIVITFDGTTNANGIKVYRDAVLLNSYTASNAATNPHDTNLVTINLGYVQGIITTRMFTEEFVIWDAVIDPTSVALTSGTGSLNGASRTSFVNVAAYDGTVSADPGITNVLSGTGYTINGTSLTGSYHDKVSVDPGIANVRQGTGYTINDVSLTGSLHIYTNTNPGASNVREGVGYTYNDTSITGTHHDPVYTNPGQSNVLAGIGYTYNDTSITGTYSVPSYSDPGVSNVRSGTSYTYNSSTNVGTLDVPTAHSATLGTVNVSDIKETVRYVLDIANTTTGIPIDLSGNMSRRVKSVLKVNPEALRLNADIFPYVTIFTSKKDIVNTSLGPQQSVKKKATFTFTIVGCVWNDYTTDYREDPADEDIEKLMENVELILRNYTSLNNKVNWQFPTAITYHSSPLNESSHVRVGIMDLQATVIY